MGCDIHIYTEVKKHNGTWRNCDHFKLSVRESESGYDLVSIVRDRNYSLFALLANVRNYNDMEYIHELRGLPDNLSDYVKKEADYWDMDGHSHSWATFRELKEFREKARTTKYSGLMSKEDADKVDKGEMPYVWWRGGMEETSFYREWEYETDQLGPLVEKLQEYLEEEFYVPKDEHEDMVRAVYWFDN